jgi:hypothetical protein
LPSGNGNGFNGNATEWLNVTLVHYGNWWNGQHNGINTSNNDSWYNQFLC